MLSTSIVSSSGVAFLGWPNSLFISMQKPSEYPTKQTIYGHVSYILYFFLKKKLTLGNVFTKKT